jgi:hypothetical protein
MSNYKVVNIYIMKCYNQIEHDKYLRENLHNKIWEIDLCFWKIQFYTNTDYYFYCYKPFYS